MLHNQQVESKLLNITNASSALVAVSDPDRFNIDLGQQVFHYNETKGMVSAYDTTSGQLIKSLVIDSLISKPMKLKLIKNFVILQADTMAPFDAANYVLTSDLKLIKVFGPKFREIDVSDQFLARSWGGITIEEMDNNTKQESYSICETTESYCAFKYLCNQDLLVLSKNTVTSKYQITSWRKQQHNWIKFKSSIIEIPDNEKNWHFEIIVLNENQAVLMGTEFNFSNDERCTFYCLINLDDLTCSKIKKFNFIIENPKVLNARTVIAIDKWDCKKLFIIDLQMQYQTIEIDFQFYIPSVQSSSNKISTLLLDEKKKECHICNLEVQQLNDSPPIWKADQFSRWEKLFSTVQYHILRFLDFQQLVFFQNVSKHSKAMGQYPALWKVHYNCHFVSHANDKEIKLDKPQDYYQSFRTAYIHLKEKMPFADRHWLRRFKENNFVGTMKYEALQQLDKLDHLNLPFSYWAVKNNHKERLQCIYESRQDLSTAIYCNQKTAIKDFIAKGNKITVGNLVSAVQMGDLDVIQTLIPFVKKFDSLESLLEWAVSLRHYDIAAFLIDHDCWKPPFYQNNLERALLVAANNNNIDMVELLLLYGAKVTAFDNGYNNSPYNLTTNKQIKKLLLCAEIDFVIQAIADEKPKKTFSLFKSPNAMEIAVKLKCALQTGTEKEFLDKFKPDKFPEKLIGLYYKIRGFNESYLLQNDHKMEKRGAVC